VVNDGHLLGSWSVGANGISGTKRPGDYETDGEEEQQRQADEETGPGEKPVRCRWGLGRETVISL